MRLWSFHPKYLDSRGLVALWREALLAQAVLGGATTGYRHHPQLERFRASAAPLASIAAYLGCVHREALARGYSFNAALIRGSSTLNRRAPLPPMPLAQGQLDYEWRLLLGKLATRSPSDLARLKNIESPEPHELFRLVPGGIATWERVKPIRGGGGV